MTTIAATTASARPARMRRGVRAGLIAAALALGAGPFGHLAVAHADFNQNWFDWCMNNLEEGHEYCCEHSGGVIRSGACVDPATLRASLGPIVTGPTRPLPPVVTGPTLTVMSPVG